MPAPEGGPAWSRIMSTWASPRRRPLSDSRPFSSRSERLRHSRYSAGPGVAGGLRNKAREANSNTEQEGGKGGRLSYARTHLVPYGRADEMLSHALMSCLVSRQKFGHSRANPCAPSSSNTGRFVVLIWERHGWDWARHLARTSLGLLCLRLGRRRNHVTIAHGLRSAAHRKRSRD